MSSSEEYLDSLLDSILSGDQAGDGPDDKDAQGSAGETRTNADAGKAMSTAEIEEMLVSMGSLGNEDEVAVDEMTDLSDMSLDELSLDDISLEESAAEDAVDLGEGELSQDEMAMDDLSLDDLSLDDLSLDNLSLEENAVEETVDLGEGELSQDEMAMDDLSLDDLSLDDLSLDNLSLEESAATEDAADLGEGELSQDEMALDDLVLDDLNLDDLALEESGEEGVGEDEPESAMEIEELDLDTDDGMEGLALEEHMLDEMEVSDDTDGLMSEEDIDRLLSGEDSLDSVGDFALEESEEGADDLSDLLAGMDHDEELSEINDLLEASDQGVSADDDILAMLEGTEDNSDSFDFFENDDAAREAGSIRELSPEEAAAREGDGKKPKKEKKKRKKLFGKKKKEAEEGESAETESERTELEDLLGTEDEETEAPAEDKKPGVFTRIMNFLLESDEEEDPLAAEILADNEGETGTITDENKELLAELSEEDKKGKKKKKKDKKGKKGKDGEGAEGEEGAEDKKAKKKKKKEKKKQEDVDLLAPPEKKLSKKKVMTVFLFCATLAACIIMVTTVLPNYMQKREAHMAYDQKDYGEVFTLLYDQKRSEEDEILFQRSNLVLQMERKLDSYDNYSKLNMRLEALNALISGVSRYQAILPEAEKYNVVGEVSDSYAQILERLSADFGVSEEQAYEIIASEDDVTYSQKLEAIINGALYGEDIPAGRQDVLPEEEEIIERIEGLDD